MGARKPPRVMAMPALSEGTKGALAGGFKGGDGGGPIQRGTVAEHLNRREGHAASRPVVPVECGEPACQPLCGKRRGGGLDLGFAGRRGAAHPGQTAKDRTRRLTTDTVAQSLRLVPERHASVQKGHFGSMLASPGERRIRE